MNEFEGIGVRLAVWHVDTVSDFTTGVVDGTQPPYNNGSSEGETVLALGHNRSGANTGIWVLGSHADPSAIPVTRRADAVVGSRFWTGELIGHIDSGATLTMYKFTVFDDNDPVGIKLSAEVNFDTIHVQANPL